MKDIFFIFCFLLSNIIIAQTSREQSIEESELGWYKVYHFTGARQIKKMDDRVFSIAQLSICDSLANWMQASYLPKGGVGDVKRTVFPEASIYRPYNAALPQGYGATAYTWNVSYNSENKLVRIPETETPWAVEANTVPGWPIPDLSTTSRYFFTMPSFEAASGREELKKEQDLSLVPNIKPYTYFWIKNIEAGGGTEYVLLCKDNKSPFIKLTKGQYLQLLETAIPAAYEKEKKKIHDPNSWNSQKNIDYYMKYLDEKHAKRMACLNSSKEKYKDRLNEVAETFSPQPNVILENYTDVFEGTAGSTTRYPVYTIDPSMVELCKKDKPQWILVSWSWVAAQPKEKHMHESIINNFNFDYVYNFFFFPEKVTGQRYKPVRSPFIREAATVAQSSDESKKAAFDKSVHYFEDFSSTNLGKKPNGWYAKGNSSGVSSTVVSIHDVPGNWAELAGNSLIPNNVKKPLPQNFTLSYDIIVPENFTWGAKGLVLRLAKEKTEGMAEAFVQLKLRPGFSGRNGEAELETKFPSAYANGTKWYAATGFSNDKKVNRINVSIKKSGELIQVMIDKNVIAEYVKGVPADMSFNALSFSMANSGGENDKYLISNIRITKD
jgi:hypothetical protein